MVVPLIVDKLDNDRDPATPFRSIPPRNMCAHPKRTPWWRELRLVPTYRISITGEVMEVTESGTGTSTFLRTDGEVPTLKVPL